MEVPHGNDSDYVYESGSETENESDYSQDKEEMNDTEEITLPVRRDPAMIRPIQLIPTFAPAHFQGQMQPWIILPQEGTSPRVIKPPVRYMDEYTIPPPFHSARGTNSPTQRPSVIAKTYENQEERRSALGLRKKANIISFAEYDSVFASSDSEWESGSGEERSPSSRQSMPSSRFSSRAQSPTDGVWSDPQTAFEEPIGISKLLGKREKVNPTQPSVYASPKISSRVIESFNGSDKKPVEYLVKYKNKSYLHCRWIDEKDILSEKGGQLRIRAFEKRLNSGIIDNDEPINPDFIEIERIVASTYVEPPSVTEYAVVDEIEGDEVSGEDVNEKASSMEVKDEIQNEEDFVNEISKIQLPGGGAETESKFVYLVKWVSLQYEEATWEFPEVLKDDLQVQLFEERSKPLSLEEMAQSSSSYGRGHAPTQQLDKSPKYENDNELRDYQVEGLNWLAFSWHQGRNVILADEMGLGKTIQCVALLDYLDRQQNVRGPFLVVAPLSTLPHWQRTFEGWTKMNTIVFHGSQESRRAILSHEFYYENIAARNVYKFNVLVTTYEMIMAARDDLADIDWKYMIVDEAHRLKNRESKLIVELREYRFDACLLMTGTPLQNNTEELWTLLNFMEPHKFHSLGSFLYQFGDLKEAEQVKELHVALAPHFLRRMKENVEKSIAPKEETIVEVELTRLQKIYYVAIYKKNFEHLRKGSKSSNLPSLLNIFMELRKCCNHPYLVRGVEESVYQDIKEDATQDTLMETLVKASGKMVFVDKLLKKLNSEGEHKVLIFSQFTRVLDILEDYLVHQRYSYERIDGQIRGNERQESIDRFCAEESDRFVFLLCTRAGGLGINLTAADIVIMYDSDWNPQNDIQAAARCHRIGQTKNVKIYRLVTRGTYESVMFQRANLKLGLDHAVLGKYQGMGSTDPFFSDNAKAMSKNTSSSAAAEYRKEIERLLKYGYFREDNNAESEEFCEADIENILRERSSTIKRDNSGAILNNQYAKAKFVTTEGINVNMDDPDFWQKVMPESEAENEARKLSSLSDVHPRARRSTNRYGMVNENDTELVGTEWYNYGSDMQEMKNQHWKKSERQRMINSLKAFGVNRWPTVQHRYFRGRSLDEVIYFGITMIELGINIYTKMKDAVAADPTKPQRSKSKKEAKERALIIATLTEYIRKSKEKVMEGLFVQSGKSDWKRFEKKLTSFMGVIFEDEFKGHLERNSQIIFTAIDICTKLSNWMQEYTKLVAKALEMCELSEVELDSLLNPVPEGQERSKRPRGPPLLLIEKVFRLREILPEKYEAVMASLGDLREEKREEELRYEGHHIKPMNEHWSDELDDELLIGYSIHGFGHVDDLRKDHNLKFKKIDEELLGNQKNAEDAKKDGEETADVGKGTEGGDEKEKEGDGETKGMGSSQPVSIILPSAQYLNKRARRLLHHFNNYMTRMKEIKEGVFPESHFRRREPRAAGATSKIWTKKEKATFTKYATLQGLPFIIESELTEKLNEALEKGLDRRKETKGEGEGRMDLEQSEGVEEENMDVDEQKSENNELSTSLSDREIAKMQELIREQILNNKWDEWHANCGIQNKTVKLLKDYAANFLAEARRAERDGFRMKEELDAGENADGDQSADVEADSVAETKEEASEETKEETTEKKEEEHMKTAAQKREDAKESMVVVLTFKQASAFLLRQRFLKFIHTALYKKEALIEEVPEGAMDEWNKLPSWWIVGLHDKGLLTGVLKHGFDFLAIEGDPDLPFDAVRRNLESEALQSSAPPQEDTVQKETPKDFHLHFPTIRAILKRLENIVTIINPTADPRGLSGRRRGREDVGDLRDDEILPNAGKKPRKRGKRDFYELSTSLPVVSVDEDGTVKTPLTVNAVTIVDFGVIRPEYHNFHTEKYIWPIGFASERLFYSTITPDERVKYRSEIRERNGSPLFVVVPSDCPDRAVSHSSPSGAWLVLVRRANDIRSTKRKDKNLTISGPEAFGIAHPLIQKTIQEMPGADQCRRYRMKKFVWVGGKRKSGWGGSGDTKRGRWSSPRANTSRDTHENDASKSEIVGEVANSNMSAKSEEKKEPVQTKLTATIARLEEHATSSPSSVEETKPEDSSNQVQTSQPLQNPQQPRNPALYYGAPQLFRVPAYHMQQPPHENSAAYKPPVQQVPPYPLQSQQPHQMHPGAPYWFPYPQRIAAAQGSSPQAQEMGIPSTNGNIGVPATIPMPAASVRVQPMREPVIPKEENEVTHGSALPSRNDFEGK